MYSNHADGLIPNRCRFFNYPNRISDTICNTPMRKWEEHLVGRRARVLLVRGYQHQLRIIAGRIAVIIRRMHLDSQ